MLLTESVLLTRAIPFLYLSGHCLFEISKMLRFAAKRLRQTRRSLSTVLLLTVGAISILQSQQPALSRSNYAIATRQTDLICYMQNSSGSVINLSRFCAEDGDTVAISTTDRRFLELYQRSSEGRSSSPSVQAQNPQALVERAQALCTAARSRQSQPQIRRVRGSFETLTFEALALEYYCPELDE